MFQVTAIYSDSEIGYGEGETLTYAIDDCGASISSIFEGETVRLIILENDAIFARPSGEIYLTMNGETAIDI